MGSDLPPPGFDPNAPLARFVLGVAQAFYGEPEVDPAERNPEEIKSQVERLIIEVIPEPPADASRTPEELANEAVAAAWEAFELGDERAEDLALAALRYSPNCADAYTLLGVSAGEQLEVAMPLFTLGVMAGAAAMGPDGFERYAGHFWEAPETRPFMGALGFLARANRDAGAADAAAAHFVEMLNLNPRDEQGARFDLLALSLEVGKQDTATRILAAFPDETSPAFAYGRALLEFQRSGDSDPARLALRSARAANGEFVDFLLQLRPLPETIADLESPDAETEALLLLELMGRAWENTKGAKEWIRKHTVPVAAAPPAKEKRSGPRQI